MVVIRKMKEKCKDAARKRREKERAEFVELSKLLPLPSSVTNQLDKASVIRLTSSYLRMRTTFPQGLGENWGTKGRKGRANMGGEALNLRLPLDRQTETYTPIDCGQTIAVPNNGSSSADNYRPRHIRELGSLILHTLDGFVFTLHRDGKIMYISETVSVVLGLPQIDLTGSNVFEYVHPADHNDILNVLNLNDADREDIAQRTSGSDEAKRDSTLAGGNPMGADGSLDDEEHCIELSRSFCLRMKCILPKRNAGLVNNGYKAIHCNGYLKIRRRCKTSKQDCTLVSAPSNRINCSKLSLTGPAVLNHDQDHHQQDRDWESYALVAVGHSLLPTASTEIKLGASTFMFRATLDFRLYHIEAPALMLLGYQQDELTGHSLYQFVHVADLRPLEQAHKQLLDKGQVVSRYCRLMCRDGGYIWMQMFATLVNNPKSMPKPQHIVAICYVIGTDLIDKSSSIATGEQQQPVKMHSKSGLPINGLDKKHKMSHTTCSQPHNPSGPKRDMDDSSLVQSGQSERVTNRKLRKSVAQHQQPHEVGSPRRASQTSSQGKKQDTVDVHCSQQQVSPIYTEDNLLEKCNIIRSARRPSEDTCSVVSSVASASVSTSSGYSSNMSVLSSCPHSASSSCSSSLSSSESIISTPAPFQYYSQAQTPSGTSQYQQVQIHNGMQDGRNQPVVNWIMPTVHYTNYDAERTKTIGRLVSDANHTSYDAHDLSWETTAASSTTTVISSISSSIATNLNSEDSPRIGGQILSSPERAYSNDQFYHRLDEQPIGDGYYRDCAAPLHLDSKCIRETSFTDDSSHSYSYHYTSSQRTACLSGSGYM